MARNNDRESRTSRRTPKDLGRRTKKKVCIFCKDRIEFVDYKEVNLLRKFMSDRGKIRARRVSGNCAQHQREVAVAIKTARELAMLPYTQRTTSERPGARGGRGQRSGGGAPFPRTERAPAAEASPSEDAAATEAELVEVGADEGGDE
jgi:small subunit ribosomal protein S18